MGWPYLYIKQVCCFGLTGGQGTRLPKPGIILASGASLIGNDSRSDEQWGDCTMRRSGSGSKWSKLSERS